MADQPANAQTDVEASQSAGATSADQVNRATERTVSGNLGVDRGNVFNTIDTDVGGAESQKRGIVSDANHTNINLQGWQELQLRIAQNQANLDLQVQQNAITAQANTQALLTQVLSEQARAAVKHTDLACNHQWHTQPTKNKPAQKTE